MSCLIIYGLREAMSSFCVISCEINKVSSSRVMSSSHGIDNTVCCKVVGCAIGCSKYNKKINSPIQTATQLRNRFLDIANNIDTTYVYFVKLQQ